ncbi:acetate--CoA ligase family protein [Candidatus Dojkabacteria bacterium]|nr:acetate--CoA ligase family protein [Candidatus Dojkabacteria bacterium]
MTNLDSLFNPKSIAVIGVSDNTTKLGTIIYNNIISEGYEGRVYPVNPNYKEIFGNKCYPKVGCISDAVEVAVIVIPSQFVFDVIKDCAEKKVKYAIIISAGFSETGKEGKKLEEKIVAYASKNGLRILGPNCLGIAVTRNKLDATFAAQDIEEGNIAFVSQSGAFNTALLDLAMKKNLGFSHFVSLGNKSDLNELDFLEHWLKDDRIKVIGMYIEEFENGRDLLELIRKNSLKPVVVLHPGETQEAQKAISSHTGSLAGSSIITRTALQQYGIIQVDGIEKMFNTLMILSYSKKTKGDKVAIITNAGGPGIIMTDEIVKAGLKLAEPTEKSRKLLKKSLPAAASVNNPIDIIGDAQADRYNTALNIAIKDQNIDSIICLLSPQIVTQIEETAKLLINFSLTGEKPVIPVFIGGRYIEAGLERLYNNKIASFDSPENAIYALKKLTDYSLISSRLKVASSDSIFKGESKYSNEILKYLSDKSTPLPENLVRKLASEVNFDLPKEAVVKNIDEAILFANKTRYPLVLKASTEDISHKTDFKALFLNISNENELQSAYIQLKKNIYNATNNKSPIILVQEQIRADEELIIGTNRDGDSLVYNNGKGFGHIVLFGKGGIYTEVYKDTSTGLVPMSRNQIMEMIDKTKISTVVKGTRGLQALAYEKLIDTIESVQKLVLLYPEIESIDINPAMITKERCVAVDIKIFVRK